MESQADRTLEGMPAMRGLDDEDVAAALRTGKVPAFDEAAFQDLPAAAPVRQAPADRTQEIHAADILEEMMVAGPSMDVAFEDGGAEADEALDERARTSSIAPVALELAPPSVAAPHTSASARPRAPSESSESTPVRLGPSRRLRMIVGLSMAASLLILGAAGLRLHFAQSGDGDVASLALADIASPHVANAPPPVIDVSSLPRVSAPTTGTIARTTATKLTVDGAAVTGATVLVPCGPHTIKLGSERLRKVDVPCGATLSVEPQRH